MIEYKLCKAAFLLGVLALTVSASTAATTSMFTSTNSDLSPGTLSASLGRLSVNHTANISQVSDNSVLNTSYTETGSVNGTTVFNVTASVPGDFPAGPGSYTVFVQTLNSSTSTSVSYSVAELRNWTIQNQEFRDTVSIGSRGTYGNLTLLETGNVEENVDLTVTGNLSDFVSVDDTVSLPPDNPQSVNLNFNVFRTTKFGNYTGALHLNSSSGNVSIPLHTRFVDQIPPEITDVEAPGFQATQPRHHKVTVTDNLKVLMVEAEYFRLVKNENVTRNQSVGTRGFADHDGSDVWSVLPPSNSTGVFYVEGVARDVSGNTASWTRRFNVTALDVIRVRDNIQVPRHRMGTVATTQLLEIEEETEVSITLHSFNQPLESGNETWTLAVQKKDGTRRFFDGVGETITMTGEGDFELFVRSDTAQVFNGELGVKGVPQHVPLSNVVFSGEFVNFTVPEDQNFTVFDTVHRCEAVRSDVLNESGWNCNYFVNAGIVPPGTTLGDNVRTVIPSDVQENFVEEDRKEDAQFTKRIKDLWLAVIGSSAVNATLLSLILYILFIYPSHYPLLRETTKPRVTNK